MTSDVPGLKRLLEARGMTAYALAKRLGWKPGTINRYLNGERSPAKGRALAMCRELDCDLPELFTENSPQKAK